MGTAVAHALLTPETGPRTVVDRLTDRAEALAASLNRQFGNGRASASAPDGLPTATAGADGLVHTSPAGVVAHHGLPPPADLARLGSRVVDVIYQPFEPELLARARGRTALNGGGLLVFQAAEAFRLFTGRQADRTRMLAHAAEPAASE